MPKDKTTYYLIERTRLDELPAGTVLDMLRYDHARIECNPPDGYYLLSTESAPHAPCVPRWASFGIEIAGIGRDCYALIEAAREGTLRGPAETWRRVVGRKNG